MDTAVNAAAAGDAGGNGLSVLNGGGEGGRRQPVPWVQASENGRQGRFRMMMLTRPGSGRPASKLASDTGIPAHGGVADGIPRKRPPAPDVQPATETFPGSRRAVMAGRLRQAAPALATYGAIRLVGFGVMAWMAPYVTWKGHHRSLAYLTGIWDGAAYQRIALHGYDLAMHQDPALWRHAVNLAWFPGYPAAIDALRWLPGFTVTGAGLAVTLIAGLAAAWGIMSLGTELTGEPRVGLVLAALWAVAPGSISLQMTYAEALFCALAAWALVALARRQWLTAGLLTCLAGTVRSTAMALVAAVIVAAVVQLIRSRADWWRPVAAALLAPFGLAGYWIFVAWATRHKSGWFWVEQHFWVQGNQTRSPFAGMTDTWHDILTVLLVGGKPSRTVVTLIVVAAVVLLLWSFAERLPWYAHVYTVAMVLLALDTGWAWPAQPRYLLPAFMLALPLARLLARAPARVLIPLAGSLAAASAWFGVYMMLIAGFAP